MDIIEKINLFIKGYSFVDRADDRIKILGFYLEHGVARLYGKPEECEVLIISFWNQPIPLWVPLTDSVKKDFVVFLEKCSTEPEATLILPLKRNTAKLAFFVKNHPNKKRKITIRQGIQRTYYSLTDDYIHKLKTYMERYLS